MANGDRRPTQEEGLTDEELERVRKLVGLGPPDPSDAPDADAALSDDDIDAILQSPDFGMPKHLGNLTPDNVVETLDGGIAKVRAEAARVARPLADRRPDAVMADLDERETMSRTVHYAVAKQADTAAVLKRLRSGPKMPEGPGESVLAFLHRQGEMGAVLEELFRIDLILRVGGVRRDERFRAVAYGRFEEVRDRTVRSVRSFLDGTAGAIDGSLHVKIAADEVLLALTEAKLDEVLDHFYTEICVRYADLVSADHKFNSWRLLNALSAQ